MQLDHRPWHYDDAENCFMGLKTDHEFRCLFCDTPLVIHSAKLLEFSLLKEKKLDSKAIDVIFRCPKCGYIDIYGVAVSEEHWAETKGKILKSMETEPYVFAKETRKKVT